MIVRIPKSWWRHITVSVDNSSLGLILTKRHLPDTLAKLLTLLILFLFFQFVEISHHTGHWFFVHWDSLLENVESSCYYIELTDDFLQSLRKLFTAASYPTVVFGRLRLSVVHIDCCSNLRFTRWFNLIFFIYIWFWGRLEFWSLGVANFFSRGRSFIYWRNTPCLLLLLTTFCSKVFDELLLVFLQIAFPNHYYRVWTSRSKIISTGWKSCRCWWALVAV